MSDRDNVNVYIAVALIAGIIAVLVMAFVYQSELGTSDKSVVPVVTVTATKVIVVVVGNSTTCTDNETAANSTAIC